LVLRATIAEIEPVIWRKVSVPDRYSLRQLHRVFQLAFGWLDYHLYEFRFGVRRFEEPDPEAKGEDAAATILRDLDLRAGATFEYLYDFGDGWVHEVRVEDVVPTPAEEVDHPLPRLLDGERAGPPEDVGGAPGYENFIEAINDSMHPQHAELRTWVGEGYDPERFDRWATDRAIALAAAWGAV
jgi:hypothetical protein